MIEDDQDVFHIIASSNGGADHANNYDFARGQAWNRAIGSKFDHLNCYMAGKSKCQKAVLVSQQLGNGRTLYSGKSAEQLYKEGEAYMRTARASMRQEAKTEL